MDKTEIRLPITPSKIEQSTWKFVKLSQVCKKISVGLAVSVTEHFRSSGIPLIRNQNIKKGFFDDKEMVYISTEFDNKNKSKRVKKGDIVIVRTGSNIGLACVVPDNYSGAQTFTTLIVRPTAELESRYLSLHINSYGEREVERLSAGGGKPNLNAGVLKNYELLLPPKEEQQLISLILGKWDKAIDLTQNFIAAKEEQKKGLMQRLLTGKVRVKGFNGEWREVKLGDIFKERKEKGFDNLELLSIGANGVYPQSESNKKDNSNSDKSKYKRICPGDIGYNTMRMWQGRSAVSTLEGIVSPAYTIVTPKKGIDVNFMGSLFRLPKTIHSFWRHSQGLVNDTLNCKFPNFALVKVRIPPTYEEQVAISKILKTAEDEIKILNNKLIELKEQKKGLMQRLLTGKIRVK